MTVHDIHKRTESLLIRRSRDRSPPSPPQNELNCRCIDGDHSSHSSNETQSSESSSVTVRGCVPLLEGEETFIRATRWTTYGTTADGRYAFVVRGGTQ